MKRTSPPAAAFGLFVGTVVALYGVALGLSPVPAVALGVVIGLVMTLLFHVLVRLLMDLGRGKSGDGADAGPADQWLTAGVVTVLLIGGLAIDYFLESTGLVPWVLTSALFLGGVVVLRWWTTSRRRSSPSTRADEIPPHRR